MFIIKFSNTRGEFFIAQQYMIVTSNRSYTHYARESDNKHLSVFA